MTASASPAATAPPPAELDPRYARPASEAALARAVAALEANGFAVLVTNDRTEARRRVLELIPKGAEVLDVSSRTLQETGIAEAIAASGEFRAVRPRLIAAMQAGRRDEARELGARPEVVVGSVHAITEDGKVVVVSATGSQLAPYASGAGKVIWVVGLQKIVFDLDAALARIENYTYRLEDARARQVYGMPSTLAKTLIVHRETAPGRVTIVLVREPLGF
jgi:DNA-binding MarR family transcriptional regulator